MPILARLFMPRRNDTTGMPTEPAQRLDSMTHQQPLARRAGILCNDVAFQKFAAMRSGFPGQQFSNTAAAEYLRTICGIQSRRNLDTDPIAARHFAALHTEFDAWAGRIAPQR